MRITLKGIKQLEASGQETAKPELPVGWVNLDVVYCAVCRTDAKLWNEGHRDLALPRVPGHEIVAANNGKHYVVWPGISCGKCRHCAKGNENLCEEMKIIGFHVNGGFANTIQVPENCLIPVPETVSLANASFAEPAGCVVNAFRKLDLKPKERILIYGGGTVGLLAALIADKYGAIPVVLEKNETKIQKAAAFSELTSIEIIKDTNDSHFDCVLNACADPVAFFNSITRTDKGGRIAFFSGLGKNEQVETNLLNLIHYKELNVSGSYGLTKSDMETGLQLLTGIEKPLALLTEKIIAPQQMEAVILSVLRGDTYKYIVRFNGADCAEFISGKPAQQKADYSKSVTPKSEIIAGFVIPGINKQLAAEAQQKIDNKTKPLGSLGTLESLAVKMSTIQNTLNPETGRKCMFVFAADHGIAEEGVSAFPQKVTREMVQNFLDQGAAINVLCKHGGIDLRVADLGIKGDSIIHPLLLNKAVANGTKNFALQEAMTIAEAEAAVEAGIGIFTAEYEKEAVNVVGLGEMGIANTSSATAIISAITDNSVSDCAGRGTGVDNQGLVHKIEVIERALKLHAPDPENAFDVLAKVGGFEIAALAGVVIAAAAKRCAVVVDGLISTAAGLIAYTMNPAVADYMIAGHKSVERGHNFALKHIGIEPVLDLNLRLGEGTGAALAINLIEAGCKIMNEMASFDEAGVSKKEVRNG
uniref:nicotinate-nucleotide--dimethylbenzimidazole phosphoribosyltransferase n=1 Tax=uncultured Draconibacterium sp. TaxID=1573823 RepID=UPI0032169504